jgi:hypothetical protein
VAGDRRTQFNNWLSQDDVIEFKKTLAKKYGIYQNNMQSYEVGLLIKWYNSVGGHIPTNAHTRAFSKSKD